MYTRETMRMIGYLQIPLLLMLSLSAIRFNEWHAGFPTAFAGFILFFELYVLLVAVPSFFSKPHELEGMMERTMRRSSPNAKMTAIVLITLFSSVFLILLPFPVTVLLLWCMFNFGAAVFISVSQRMGVYLLAASQQADQSTFIGQLISVTTAFLFYPVYVTSSRLLSLPWYIRKPVMLVGLAVWLLLVFFSARLFIEE